MIPVVADPVVREAIALAAHQEYELHHIDRDWKTHVKDGCSLKFVRARNSTKILPTWVDVNGNPVMETLGPNSVRRDVAKFRFHAVCPMHNVALGPTGNILPPGCEPTEGQQGIEDKYLVHPDLVAAGKDPYGGSKHTVAFDGYDGIGGDMGMEGKYNDINNATQFINRYVPDAYAMYRLTDHEWRADYLAGLPIDDAEVATDASLRIRVASEFKSSAYLKCKPRTQAQHGFVRVEQYVYSRPYSGIKPDVIDMRAKTNIPLLKPEWDTHGVLKAICGRERGMQLNSLPIKDHDLNDIWGTAKGRTYLESITLGTLCSVTISLKELYPNPMNQSGYIAVWVMESLRILCAPCSAGGGGQSDAPKLALSVTEILEQCRKRPAPEDSDDNSKKQRTEDNNEMHDTTPGVCSDEENGSPMAD
jgi:hypothetical protein